MGLKLWCFFCPGQKPACVTIADRGHCRECAIRAGISLPRSRAEPETINVGLSQKEISLLVDALSLARDADPGEGDDYEAATSLLDRIRMLLI